MRLPCPRASIRACVRACILCFTVRRVYQRSQEVAATGDDETMRPEKWGSPLGSVRA